MGRYLFKMSFFFDFIGQRDRAIENYRHSFDALKNAADIIEEEMMDQIKSLADYANFKICSNLLRKGKVVEASQQFHSHTIRSLPSRGHCANSNFVECFHTLFATPYYAPFLFPPSPFPSTDTHTHEKRLLQTKLLTFSS